jgi:hypothetical protein
MNHYNSDILTDGWASISESISGTLILRIGLYLVAKL